MSEKRGDRKDLGDKGKRGRKDPEGTFRKSNTYLDSALTPLEVSGELDELRRNALHALNLKSASWKVPQLKGLEHDIIAEIMREITKRADDPAINRYIQNLPANLADRVIGPTTGTPSTCTLETSLILDISILEVATRIAAPYKPDRKVFARVREAFMTASTKVGYIDFHEEGNRNKPLIRRRLPMYYFQIDPQQWATTYNREGEEDKNGRIKIRPGDMLLFECKSSYTKSPSTFYVIKNLAMLPDTEMFRKLKDIHERELGFCQSRAKKEGDRLRQDLIAKARANGRKGSLNKEEQDEIKRAQAACFMYELSKEKLWRSLEHEGRYVVNRNSKTYPHMSNLDTDIDACVQGLKEAQLISDFKRQGVKGIKERLIFYLNPNYLEDSARKAEELIREREAELLGTEKRRPGRPSKSKK